MVASTSCTCASVRTTPLSCTRTVPSPVSSAGSNQISPDVTEPPRGDRVDRVLQQL
ncbi:hypothetical protein [Paractinoplanes deccanensis]|uniref:hypothetical protein n=1 Tax=Paractinoplanes deccanensis TaxID=113561 RepID=UPI00361F768F